MKKSRINILFLSISVCLSGIVFSQASANDFQRLKLAAVILPQVTTIPEEGHSLIENKMNQIVSANGMAGGVKSSRFIITPNVVVLTKEITGGAPILYTLKLEVSFYIGDVVSGTKFSNSSVTVTGVGGSENKAYVDALKRIDANDANIKRAVEEGKTKIINYYDQNCDVIISGAMAKANSNKFDEAIYDLSSIPDACETCYNKALSKLSSVFQSKINYECKVLMNQANNIWSTNQDYYGADEASRYLAEINPGSACYQEAQVLNDKIAKRMKEIDQREWAFQLKQQQDAVDIEKAYIKAARDIGVAYGEGQPQTITTTYNVIWW